MENKISIVLNERQAMCLSDAINMMGAAYLKRGNVELLAKAVGEINKALAYGLYGQKEILELLNMVHKIVQWGEAINNPTQQGEI